MHPRFPGSLALVASLAALIACDWDPDFDGDGHLPTSYPGGDDCAPHDAAIPREEQCNDFDDDCDGIVDGSLDGHVPSDAPSWYLDADEDGYGIESSAVSACDAPAGYAPQAGDCIPSNSSIHPGATESCNKVDDDCDEDIDEAGSNGELTWYRDGDDDGHGDAAATTTACEQPDGYVDSDDDCDDGDEFVNPEADEVCGNDKDDNCDESAGPCDFAGTTSLEDARAIYSGKEPDGYAGFAVTLLPDFEGDGGAEVVIGLHWYDTGSGGVAIIPSSEALASADIGTAGYTISGMSDENAGSALGFADVDSDGWSDLLVGAPGGESGTAYAFSATRLDGAGLPVDMLDADVILVGEFFDEAGTSIVGIGDFDGDGNDDFAVGAPGNGSGAGLVYVEKGPLGGFMALDDAPLRLHGNVCCDAAGFDLAGVGDVDGDGDPDLLVGARSATVGEDAPGAAYLVTTFTLGDQTMSDAEAQWYGESDQAEAGRSVGAPGDIDEDGYADLLVGARWDDGGGADAGAAYLVLGPTTGDTSLAGADGVIRGAAAGDEFGRDVAGIGDINGDDQLDIAISAYKSDEGGDDSGSTHVFTSIPLGAHSADDAEATLLGTHAGDWSGHSLAGGQDVDSDGVDDLLVGAIGVNNGTPWEGAAYLVVGRTW